MPTAKSSQREKIDSGSQVRHVHTRTAYAQYVTTGSEVTDTTIEMFDVPKGFVPHSVTLNTQDLGTGTITLTAGTAADPDAFVTSVSAASRACKTNTGVGIDLLTDKTSFNVHMTLSAATVEVGKKIYLTAHLVKPQDKDQ